MVGVGLKGLEGILRLVFSALLFFQERFSGAAPQTYPQGSHVPLTSLLSTSLLQEPSFHHRTPSRLPDQQLSYHSCPSPSQGAAAPSPGETCLSRSDWLRLFIANLPSTSPTSLTKRQLSCGRDHFPTLHTHTHTHSPAMTTSRVLQVAAYTRIPQRLLLGFKRHAQSQTREQRSEEKLSHLQSVTKKREDREKE